MKRLVLSLVAAFIVVPIAFVLYQGVSTLRVLTEVERERDTWQRPGDVLRHLNLRAGTTVVDLGLHDAGHGAGTGRSHGLDPSEAEPVVLAQGFELVMRDDRFIDRPSDDPWWLLVFEKR
ncbi:MAG: hypothetical protein IT184_18090 [Acidobacteria bacterium]|nr:hypothetical protein [Acidobacteriota bacterium]